jgi:hypothetical protein
MTMKTECCGCGEDCSHAYGTYQGYPYHFGCLPTPNRKPKPVAQDRADPDLVREGKAKWPY